VARRRSKADEAAMVIPGLEDAYRPVAGPVKPRARAMSRIRSPARTPVPVAWDCVILAVDTASISGWSIVLRGLHVEQGELDTLDVEELRRVVRLANELARNEQLPCVLVLEAPWGGSPVIVAALGAARERWESVWRELAEGHRGKVVRVAVSTWRTAVLGADYAYAERNDARTRERQVAREITGHDCGPDASPAVCIGYWASHAPMVGELIGKRAVKRSFAGANE
jgi:hypothetical protein